MRNQAFTTGQAFLIDLDEVHEFIAQTCQDEMGHRPFPGVVEGFIADLLLYTFCGDQHAGERVLEKRLLKLHFGELHAIKVTRTAFERMFQILGVEDQRHLLGNYQYHYDNERRLVMVRGSMTLRKKYRDDIDATIAELEDLIANGDFVPERLRRLICEHRAG